MSHPKCNLRTGRKTRRGAPRLAACCEACERRAGMMLPLLWPVGLALPGEQDRALHALGLSETANATSLPKLSKQACLDQLSALSSPSRGSSGVRIPKPGRPR